MDIILKYFPELTSIQKDKFAQLQSLYTEWNEKINVISRKDIDALYEKHVLHSLGIAKVITFQNGTEILDIGTGGGFPGIPLAILFPHVNFHLVDSIRKKITVVTEISNALGLTNVTAENIRAELINKKYDFVISRAVTQFDEFLPWVKNKFEKTGFNELPNGILYLKGGDLTEELARVKKSVTLYNLSDFFKEEFFESKKVVYYKA